MIESSLDKAKKMIENHNSLVIQEYEIQDKIHKEEMKVRDDLLKLIDGMSKDEFREFFHHMKEDSNLKYECFLRYKNK